MKKIFLFILTFLTVFFLDIIWIKFFAFPIYQNEINQFLKEDINIFSGFLTYLLISFSIYYFSIKNIDKKTKKETLISSSLIGFTIYSIYGLTNYTILSFWTIRLILTDALWGILLGLLTSLVITFLYERFLKK